MKNESRAQNRLRISQTLALLAAFWAAWVLVVYASRCPNPIPALDALLKTLGTIPFSPREVWRNLSLHLLAFAMAASLCLVLIGIGRDLRHSLRMCSGHPWTDRAIDIGLGFIALTNLWLGLGLVRLWYPSTLALAGAASALWAFRGWTASVPPTKNTFRGPDPFSDGVSRAAIRALTALGAALWALDVLQGFVPETFYDTLGYLLAVPQAWIQNHGVTDLTGNFCSGFYSQSGVFFSLGLMLEGSVLAKLLGIVAVPACALLTGGWVARSHGRSAGLLAFGITLTLPLLHLNTWAARADLWMTFLTLLAWWAFDRWSETAKNGSERWAALAGLAAGSAVAVKSVALLAFLPLPFVLIHAFASHRSVRKPCSWALAGFLLALTPWALKNIAFTGNPAFPYLQDVFGGRLLEPGTLERLLVKNHLFKPSGALEWLRLPWDLVMPGSSKAQMAGPLALAVLPLVLLGFRGTGALRRTLLTALLFLAMGLAASRNIRFYLAAFLLTECSFVTLIAGWKKPLARQAGVLICLAAAVLPLPFLPSVLSGSFDPIALWFGLESREAYLSRKLPNSYMPMAVWTQRNLPEDSLLLVAGDARALYYGVPVRANWVDDEQDLVAAVQGATDAAGVQRRLKRLGVTHLAVNGREGLEVALTNYTPYRLRRSEWARLSEWLGGYTKMVWREGLSAVYEIQPEPRNPAGDFNALSLLSGPAAIWWDNQGQPKSLPMLDAQLSLFPGDKFWLEQASHAARLMKPSNGSKKP